MDYIYQLWMVTTWFDNDDKPRKDKILLGFYSSYEKFCGAARERFQELLEDTSYRYIHVYGVMSPVDEALGADDTEKLEIGLRVDRRKRSAGCLFIANKNPI